LKCVWRSLAWEKRAITLVNNKPTLTHFLAVPSPGGQ
jgi:hypothetical protein